MAVDLTRRRFLLAFSGSVGVAWLASHAEAVDAAARHADRLARDPAARKAEFFTPDEIRVVDAASARIIPTDDTPGAREAGVVWFIDRVLARYMKEQQTSFRSGLTELQRSVKERDPSAADFAALSVDAQDATLKSMSESQAPETIGAFQGLVFMTMAGFLSNPSYGGNRNHVGWTLMGHTGGPSYSPPYSYYDNPANLERLLGRKPS